MFTCSDIDYRPGRRPRNQFDAPPPALPDYALLLLFACRCVCAIFCIYFYSQFRSGACVFLLALAYVPHRGPSWPVDEFPQAAVVMQMNRSLRFLFDVSHNRIMDTDDGHKKVSCLIASTPILSRTVEKQTLQTCGPIGNF